MQSLILDTIKNNRTPAKLDYLQSATGLILGLFMWGHMLLVSSILLGKDTMYYVAKALEGGVLTGFTKTYPILVTLAVLGITTIFVVHAALAVRKFPITWKQHKIMRQHVQMMNHVDTNQWYTQFITGFLMFFLGSAHLFFMMTHPADIGPYSSADRMFSSGWWPIYLVLLFCVELHGTIGLYRLAVKWGWFDGKNGKNARAARKTLKTVKRILTVFFLVLGLATLGAYVKIGIEHSDAVGERYTPAASAHM